MNQRLFLTAFLAIVILSVYYLHRKRYSLADMPYTIDHASGEIVCSGQVKAEGMTTGQLYERGKKFIRSYFLNGEEALLVDDRAKGVLVGKGVIKGLVSMKTVGMDYEAPIEIRIRDGAYSYRLTNLSIVSPDKTIRYRIDYDLRMDNPFDTVAANPYPQDLMMSQRQFEEHMMKLKPFTDFIAQLRNTMSQP
ncbi:DUF4468 domain-containing protein [Larkinella soli]|uniref:DUF4468 domain-containing protein n=1 Tax=Larkinella soli TaxID=1770527 RepID=UPI000FFC2BC2|nr:DUF4468 domain-containing protein [Larkinella soli]